MFIPFVSPAVAALAYKLHIMIMMMPPFAYQTYMHTLIHRISSIRMFLLLS